MAKPGRTVVASVLPELLSSDRIDVVIANAENLAHGRGASVETIREMMAAGVSYFTGGDHLFRQKGFDLAVGGLPVIRPANYPGDVPGVGHMLIEVEGKGTLLLMNLMGRTFLNERLDNPFTKADQILDSYRTNNVSASLVDFHAESTSEKEALGYYLDGRVTALVGTHTHVPTCDCKTLPEGTLYVSDVGMTGNVDSVLGVRKDIIISSYLTGMNQKFEWEEKGKAEFRSVVIDTEEKTIKRLDR